MISLLPLFNTVLSKKMHALVYFLGYISQKNNFKIYGVGGFVRDLILGRENRTVSLLVEGSAVDFALKFQQIMPAVRLQYDKEMGTAKLFLPDEIVLDMVTARKEFYAFSDTLSARQLMLKNSLYKQNFTINTMACAFNPLEFGRLYDYFGGKKDLKNGIIRALYKLSFVEDPTRIIQAVRFEQRFDFQIEEETAALLYKGHSSFLLKKISKEKLYHEIRLIFKEPSPLKVLTRLDELDLFKVVLPRIIFNDAIKTRLQRAEEALSKFPVKKPGSDLNHFVLFLSVIFYEMKRHDILFLCHLMRLKYKERRKIIFIYDHIREILLQLQPPHLNPSRLYYLLRGVPEEGLLLILALHTETRVGERILFYREHLSRKKPVTKIADLQEKGLQPGPLLNCLCQNLQKAVLENKIRGREEELAFINVLLEQKNISLE